MNGGPDLYSFSTEKARFQTLRTAAGVFPPPVKADVSVEDVDTMLWMLITAQVRSNAHFSSLLFYFCLPRKTFFYYSMCWRGNTTKVINPGGSGQRASGRHCEGKHVEDRDC